MASSKDYNLPYQDLINLVPKNLRNPTVTSLLDNLFNRFLTKDEAIPLYGYVGRTPSSPDDRTPKVPQSSVERDINALIPVLSFKVGTETYSFTVQDLVRKAEVLGIRTNQSEWLYSQGNNYAPPITFDKFTNFFNYYWVAQAVPNPPSLAWNPTNAPEFYTIAKPGLTDKNKINVRVATTGAIVPTGTGFNPQTWTMVFSDPTHAALSASGPGTPGQVTVPVVLDSDNKQVIFQALNSSGINQVLLSFNVVREDYLDADGAVAGHEAFEAGDKFTITAPFISSTYTVAFSGSTGIKGRITNLNSLDAYQTVDGVQLKENDRVLIKDGQDDERGIYIVKPGDWIRADDSTSFESGAKVFVTEGDTNAGTLYTSTSTGNWSGVPNSISNTNDWQESNYWLSGEEVAAADLDQSKVIQATRPIIEFQADIQLNTHVDGNLPSDDGVEFEQIKTEFNQAPLFDLFRYDGTHAKLASPLFYYVEDPTADIDPVLQRRTKHATNESGDFLFAHGLLDGVSLLFYKRNEELGTIWSAGYAEPTFDQAKDIVYGGIGDGLMVVTPASPFIDQQVFTAIAQTPTTFKVAGSKNAVIDNPIITVGTAYDNGLFTALIIAGGTDFVPGDQFTFRIGNFETTRYVSRDSTGQLFDLFGGEDADLAGVGAWQVPRMFYNNVAASNGGEIPEGTLYSHFRGILANQLEGQEENRAFGGSIKLWSEQQNLLASLLMQRDLTVPSMIDMAQRQYETALNAVVDIFLNEFLSYMSKTEVVTSELDTSEFLDYILSIRAKDQEVRTVLYDSTSPVIGFPATLPLLGVTPLTTPGAVFEPQLGVTLFRHHDGHFSPLYANSQEFNDRLFSPGTLVERSDGTFTAAVGSFSTTPPALPYKGELWVYSNGVGATIKSWAVLSDGDVAPVATAVGQHWFKRSANALKVWNGLAWVPETDALAAWTEIDPASLLNALMLDVEQRLYDGISSQQREYFTQLEVDNALSGPLKVQLQRELATWSADNGYDPTAPDYSASDAFTWNYRGMSPSLFAPEGGVVPARWYVALMQHQATISTPQAPIIPTERPNIEPWKLFGTTSDSAIAAFKATYTATVTPEVAEDPANGYLIGSTARVVLYTSAPSNTTLSGLPTVDGVQLSNGDGLLLVSESVPANNGLWIVSTMGWSRSGLPMIAKTVVSITEGATRSNTHWAIMNTPGTINVDPISVEQIRQWKPILWDDIQAARPGLKLSVDAFRDTLLPPYVNPIFAWSVNALTTNLPPSPSAPYVFGDGSPVETVWRKGVEYRYALAKALFRTDPLGFLGHCWGFEWVQAGNVDILFDGYDITVPGHPRFRLHGEPVTPVTARGSMAEFFSMTSIAGPGDIDVSITRTGYTENRGQSFTIRAADGTLIGYINQGETKNLNSNGYTILGLSIDDRGLPFRVGDTFVIKQDATSGGRTITFEPSSYVKFNGFGQTFTQALRAASIDTNAGYAIQAYRGWDVNLGYRAGGLISTDDLRVYTDQETLPESAYDLRVKQSPFAKDLWLQALRVEVVQIGASRTDLEGNIIALSDASDWTFRVSGYNTRYLGIEYYTYADDANYMTFNALAKANTALDWKHRETITGIQKTQLPITIRGLQNVIDMIFGYAERMTDIGWRFNDDGILNTDAETGRVRGYQLDVETLVDRVYAGITLGQGHVINPFLDRVWVMQDTGLLSEYRDTVLFDVVGHPAVFDTLGTKLATSDLQILRRREKSQIGAAVPMFSVHAQIDEFEHLFVFNNLSSPSTGEGLIYDPFSGARIVTIKLNGRRQASNTLRPEFGGHYLVGDEVKQNLQGAADKIAHYYDTDHVFEDELSTRHSLALLGFSPKQYMADLDLTDRTQFNFWRGLIQLKGTNASMDAFLNNDRFQDAKLDEYWAYKLAEYGDSRSKIFPELRVQTLDTLQQFTKLIFDPSASADDQALLLNGFKEIDADDESLWFSIDDLNGDNNFVAEVAGTYFNVVTPGLYKIPFVSDTLVPMTTNTATFTQVNGTTLNVTGAGNLAVMGYGPATPMFNPIKLINYVDPELVEEIPVWHPAAGQHTVSALASINIQSTIDPARYNVSTLVAGNSNFDPLRSWGSKELGRVWWDTTNLAYVPYYDQVIFPTVDERLSRWGAQADYSIVEVVEWVESSVPPSEYDAQAAIDAGDADIDSFSKADGTVHGAKTYSRERIWATRAVAWSRAGVALEAAHPSFNGSFFDTLSTTTGTAGQKLMTLESQLFSTLGIVAGMRIGAWQQNDSATRPLSEFQVLDAFTKSFNANSFNFTVNGLQATIGITSTTHTDVIGQLLFDAQPLVSNALTDSDGNPTGLFDVTSSFSIQELADGTTDIVFIRTDRSSTANGSFVTNVGQQFVFESSLFGLAITVTANTAGTYDTDTIAQLIKLGLAANVVVYDSVAVSQIVPFSDPDGVIMNEYHLANDPTDQSYSVGGGWRAWSVPTQAQLTADARVPDSIWFPYVGPWVSLVNTPASVVQDTVPLLTLNDGTIIERYMTTWGDWTELKTQLFKKTSLTGAVLFNSVDTFPVVPADRVSVYVNGVARLTGTYSLIGGTLDVLGVPAGSEAVAIVRAYTPTAKELAFDPDVTDDSSIQRQYKIDYQYVEVPVRDDDGTILSTKYFFWVKNRSTQARGKTLSVKAVSQYLTDGPSQYLTFQNLQNYGTTTAPDYRYNAIAISGLSYVVTKDDTFKLRFTRNFTLRDDPQQLDLKDTHTEWSLIRPGQRTRIPEQLWNKMVDTAAGQDAAGNALPAPKRTSYDERNGTRTQFGFGVDQVLAPTDLVTSTLLYTILNTRLVDDSGTVPIPDYMSFLDFNESDTFFSSPSNVRNTLTRIWNEAKVTQVNELFFAVLDDIAASNYEMTDLFKTSRLSAYSIKVVRETPIVPVYE